jgi:hypothetical protein
MKKYFVYIKRIKSYSHHFFHRIVWVKKMKILKFLKWVLQSFLFGIAVIFVFNIIGSFLNLNIPINIYTLLIVGILRIPGLVMILIFLMI